MQVTLGGSIIADSLLQSFNNGNISIQNLVYDISDRRSALQKARTAAFAEAKTEFGQYLTLTSFTNDGLVKINDLNSEVYTVYQYSPSTYALLSKLESPPQPIKVTAAVSAVWRVTA
jgi:uncharacterized protein YggE